MLVLVLLVLLVLLCGSGASFDPVSC